MSQRSRRRVLIDDLQYRLVLTNLAYLGTISLTFTVLVLSPLVADLLCGPDYSEESALTAEVFLRLLDVLWPAGLVLLTLLFVHSVILSHRIAGPLYRFRKAFTAAAAGDLTPVTLRKHDYLRNEESAINEMLSALAGRIAAARASCEEARLLTSSLRRDAAGGGDRVLTRLREGLAELEGTIDGVRSSLEPFLLPPAACAAGPRRGAPAPAPAIESA